MISALITAFLLGICTRLADKSNWLKRNPWRIGILFGILGLAADAGTAYIPEIGMAIGLQNVPAILAAFFFGPWEGIIAGTVTLVGNILVAYSGILVLPYGTAYSTLVIALYAFVVKKWGLDGKCPSVIPAVILTFFGEIFHLAIMFIISAALKMEADALIFLGEAYQYLPSSAAIAAGLAAILFSFKRGWKKRISMPITISLCCLLAAFLTMETVTIQIGYK